MTQHDQGLAISIDVTHLAKMLKADPFTEPIPSLDADHSPHAAMTQQNLLGS